MSTPASMQLDQYTGYNGLPAFVGLMDIESVSTRGLTIAESVDRLKRLHWALRRLHCIFIARLASMPIYELKMAFSLHAHYCAEHVLHLATRVREMRQPPYGLDSPPHPSLDIFFDEILAAPSDGLSGDGSGYWSPLAAMPKHGSRTTFRPASASTSLRADRFFFVDSRWVATALFISASNTRTASAASPRTRPSHELNR